MTTKTKGALLPAVSREEFDTMSPAEQRVAIARDVLAQIEEKRIVPTFSIWAAAGKTLSTARKHLPILFERESLVSAEARKCFTCGLGAVFVSAVRLGNECRLVTEAADYSEIRPTVERYFPRIQAEAIEYCFEAGDGDIWAGDMEKHWDEVDMDWFVSFYREHRTPTARLRAICECIIANAGDFRPVVASPATESETT